MYEYKKRQSKIKRFFLILLLIVFVSALSIFIYNMYESTEIYSKENEGSSYEATKLSRNINLENQANDITDVLDKTIKCVVGISKIKNTGNSIFLEGSTKELGLGTGMIITDNRIYSYKLACCRKQI